MTGGALEVRQAQIGCDGPGEFTVSGGTVTIKDWSAIGRYANGKGKMTITGGAEVTCIRNGSANTCLFVAEEGEGELVIEDGGKLTFTTDNQCGFVSPNNGKGRGTTWLKTGGTIATRELHIQAAGTRFILDGGTIVANAGTSGTRAPSRSRTKAGRSTSAPSTARSGSASTRTRVRPAA